MRSDNASQSVISVTMDDAKDYARLYFRPLTPTQFHNEGYKPEHIRKHEVNAMTSPDINCDVIRRIRPNFSPSPISICSI